MPPVSLPLGDKPYDQAVISVGKDVCENYYLEKTNSEAAKVPYFYVSRPGLRVFSGTAVAAPCRGIFTASNMRTFFASSNEVRELYDGGGQVHRATLNTTGGVVNFADNGTQLLIVDGTDGWILEYNTGDVTRLDPALDSQQGFPPGATHARCIDTYFIVNNPLTNEYHWSDPGDGLSWPGLNVQNKIGKPDNVVALSDVANQLWVFGLNSVEVHYDSGDYVGGVWRRYEGAILEMGCAAPHSVARYAGSVMWLGLDRDGAVGVFTNNGYQPVRISTRGIEQLIQAGKYNDCIAFCFAQSGHAYYVMQFPTTDTCFVFDLTTQAWYRWTYLKTEDGRIHRWRGMFAAYNWSKNLLGDSITDGIYWNDPACYVDEDPDGSGQSYIRRVKTLPPIYNHGFWTRFNWVQPMFQQGVGLPENTSEGVGVDPVALVAYSDDSGATWKNERAVALGKQGEFQRRSRMTILNCARNRQFRVVVTDPVAVILWGFEVDMTPMTR